MESWWNRWPKYTLKGLLFDILLNSYLFLVLSVREKDSHVKNTRSSCKDLNISTPWQLSKPHYITWGWSSGKSESVDLDLRYERLDFPFFLNNVFIILLLDFSYYSNLTMPQYCDCKESVSYLFKIILSCRCQGFSPSCDAHT